MPIQFTFPCPALFFKAGVKEPILSTTIGSLPPVGTKVNIGKEVYIINGVCVNTDHPDTTEVWVNVGTLGGDTAWHDAINHNYFRGNSSR